LTVLSILTIPVAADESLKFWKLFEKKPGAAAAAREGSANPKANLVKQMTIR
jgi:cell division cycle protein 20 (cofactor of APC complex)